MMKEKKLIPTSLGQDALRSLGCSNEPIGVILKFAANEMTWVVLQEVVRVSCPFVKAKHC